MSELENIINAAFEQRADITPANVSQEVRGAVQECLNLLDTGKARVAEKMDGRLGHQSMAQESCSIIVPHQRKPTDGRRQHPLLRQGRMQIRELQ